MPIKAQMTRRTPTGLLLIAALLFFYPVTARADAGIPMLPFAYPVILILLIPVIAIEATYLKVRLHTEWKNTIAATTKANLVTMLLGFPLAWFIFFVLEMALYAILALSGIGNHLHWTFNPHVTEFLVVVTSAAWMGPVDDKWAIPVAFVVLLIPSFVLSGYVESKLLGSRGWLHFDGQSSGPIWQANLLSYLFLAAVGCISLTQFLDGFVQILNHF